MDLPTPLQLPTVQSNLSEEQVTGILEYLSSKDERSKLQAKELGKKAGIRRSGAAEALKHDAEFMALLPPAAKNDTVIAWVDRLYKFHKTPANGGKKSEYAALARELGVSDEGSTKEMIKRILTTSIIHCVDSSKYGRFYPVGGKRGGSQLEKETTGKRLKVELEARDAALNSSSKHLFFDRDEFYLSKTEQLEEGLKFWTSLQDPEIERKLQQAVTSLIPLVVQGVPGQDLLNEVKTSVKKVLNCKLPAKFEQLLEVPDLAGCVGMLQLWMCASFDKCGKSGNTPTGEYCKNVDHVVLSGLKRNGKVSCQVFLDVLWYCRQLFASKSKKQRQCDDEPTAENKFYPTPSEIVLQLITVLQLLALKATGLQIRQIRAASLFAQKALNLVEIASNATPVNEWKSKSSLLNKILPETKFYWTCHIINFHYQYPRLMDLLKLQSSADFSSQDRGTPSDMRLKSDALWLKTMPRVLFEEFYIMASFYAPDDIISTVQAAFDFINSGKSRTGLSELLKGAGTAADMAQSMLAVYASQKSYAGDSGWVQVLDPQLRKNVVADVKKLLQSDTGKAVQKDTPPPRFWERKESRDSALKFKMLATAHDVNGTRIASEDLKTRIETAAKLIYVATAYLPVLSQKIIDRLKSKNRAVLSVKKQNEGQEKIVGTRGSAIKHVKDDKEWVSMQVLLYGGLELGAVEGKKPRVSPLFDCHILLPADADPDNVLEQFHVICRSSEKPGMFQPASWEKASIQHELLLNRVFIHIPGINLCGVAILTADERTRLCGHIRDAPVSKDLNSAELAQVIRKVIQQPIRSIPNISPTYGSESELAVKLARDSMRAAEANSVEDAAVESFMCRSRDMAKDVTYGDNLSFRAGLQESQGKVTVSGRLVKHGDIVMLVVGELYLHLADADIQSILPSGCTIKDFLWCNRPFDVVATSKTGGVLEYTLLLKDGAIFVCGLNRPLINESQSKPVMINGMLTKSQAKQKLDVHKRGKNMYVLILTARYELLPEDADGGSSTSPEASSANADLLYVRDAWARASVAQGESHRRSSNYTPEILIKRINLEKTDILARQKACNLAMEICKHVCVSLCKFADLVKYLAEIIPFDFDAADGSILSVVVTNSSCNARKPEFTLMRGDSVARIHDMFVQNIEEGVADDQGDIDMADAEPPPAAVDGTKWNFLLDMVPGQQLSMESCKCIVEASVSFFIHLDAKSKVDFLDNIADLLLYVANESMDHGKDKKKMKLPAARIVEMLNLIGPIISVQNGGTVFQTPAFALADSIRMAAENPDGTVSELILPRFDYSFAAKNCAIVLVFMSSIDRLKESFQLNPNWFKLTLKNQAYKIKNAAKEILAKSKTSGKFGSYQSKTRKFAVDVSLFEEAGDDPDPMEIDAVNVSFKDALKDEETRNELVNIKVSIDDSVNVVLSVTRWQAALYSQVSKSTTLQQVNQHNIDPLFAFLDVLSCLVDSTIMRNRISAVNINGADEIEDFVEFDDYSYVQSQILEIEGMILRCAVSFDEKNGLTGNLMNAQVNSTSSFLSSFSTTFWTELTKMDLGSTVFLDLINNWTGSVTSYLSNGRDPSKFHFSARDEYLIEPFIIPDGKVLVHLPVDLKDVSLRVGGEMLALGPTKINLKSHSRKKGTKDIFSADKLQLTFDKNNKVQVDVKLSKCLLDPATANPLIDVDKAEYYPGFAHLMLDPNTDTHSLKIPVALKRAFKTQKSQESRRVEVKNQFHMKLPDSLLPEQTRHFVSDTSIASAGGSSSGLNQDIRASIPTVPSASSHQSSAEIDPETRAHDRNRKPKRHNFAIWYDQYEIDKPDVTIADYLEEKLDIRFRNTVIKERIIHHWKYKRRIFQYDARFHPPALKNANEFGYTIFWYPGNEEITFRSEVNKHILIVDPGGNTFNQASDKGNASGYAMGQGCGSEISFKLRKIAQYQSLRDVVCEEESLENKLVELRTALARTKNETKKSKIKREIAALEQAAADLTGMHAEMKICKDKTKSAKRDLITEIEQGIAAGKEYSSADYAGRLASLEEAQNTEQKLRDKIKKETQCAVDWEAEIQKEYSKIKSRVDRIHHATLVFYSAFNAVHYPHFRPDTKKKIRGGLAKEWKAPLDWLAHGRHWKKLCARMGLYGKEMVALSEACSTMANCVCGTLHSPGRHHLHHCPREDCKKVTVRDECPRIMGVMGDVRILQRKVVLAGGRNGDSSPAPAN